MRYRMLGTTGLSVSVHCLGAGMFGALGNPDHRDCVRIIHAALDAGVNMIDVADVYSDGEAEQIVGAALRSRRDDVVLATKFGLPGGGASSVRPGGSHDPNRRGGSRRWILQAVEASLTRLGTEWIDVYQMHRPDPSVDLEDTLSALDDLVRAGKIRYPATSNTPAETLVEASLRAQHRGLARPRSEQVQYSIAARGPEASILPTARRLGMGVLAWSPLAQGWLTGRFRRASDPTDVRRPDVQPHLFDRTRPGVQAKLDLVEGLDAIASGTDLSLVHLALAFAAEHPAITSVVIGPRTMEQLEGLVGAADLELDPEVLDRIDELVTPGTYVDPADVRPNADLECDARRRRSG